MFRIGSNDAPDQLHLVLRKQEQVGAVRAVAELIEQKLANKSRLQTWEVFLAIIHIGIDTV